MKTILITGQARGGTTCVAGICQRLGVELPDAGGNLEHSEFLSWILEDNLDAIREFASRANSAYPLWGVKYPSMFLDYERLKTALSILDEPGMIVVYRDEIAIAQHRFKIFGETRTFEDIMEQLGRGKVMMNEVIPKVSNLYPVLRVSYEKIIMNKEEEVERIRQFLGVTGGDSQGAVDYIQPGKYQD